MQAGSFIWKPNPGLLALLQVLYGVLKGRSLTMEAWLQCFNDNPLPAESVSAKIMV